MADRLGTVYVGDTFEQESAPGVAHEVTDYRSGTPRRYRLTSGGYHEWLTRAELAEKWRRCDVRPARGPLYPEVA